MVRMFSEEVRQRIQLFPLKGIWASYAHASSMCEFIGIVLQRNTTLQENGHCCVPFASPVAGSLTLRTIRSFKERFQKERTRSSGQQQFSSMTSPRHSVASLGDNSLRERYDDAFGRGELANLRQQVSVLHDTLISFITKTEKRFLKQEEEQKRLFNRLSRLEKIAKLPKIKKEFTSKESRDAVASIVESGEPAGEPTPGTVYSLVDQNGNAYVATFATSSTEGVATGDIAMLSSTLSTSGLPEDDTAEKEEKEEEEEEEKESDFRDESEDIPADSPEVVMTTCAKTGRVRRHKIVKPGNVDWEQLEAESKQLIGKPERKGKGGKVSGRLGAGSPAWAHYLRTGLQRALGDQAMFRYAREGSKVFKAEKETIFGEIKDHVTDFCKRHEINPPEEKLMDEIAWAFLRNKKRYRAKL